MQPILNVTIDPGVFAPPFDRRSKESVKAYVDSLLHWTEARDSGPVRLHVPKATAQALILSDYYPLRPWLKQLLAETNTFEFDANTIAKLAGSILDQSDALEETTGITDILAEQVTIVPSIFDNYVPRPIQSASETTALVTALVRSVGRDAFALSNRLAVRDCCNSQSIAVTAVLTIIEHAREDLHNYDELPKAYNGHAPVCETFHDYLLTLDECELWNSLDKASDIETLIKIAVYKSRASRSEATTWRDLPNFRLHREFHASVQACGMAPAPPALRTFLRATAETVDGQNLAAVHPLRVDAGANSAQVMRGTDTAWRRDIDRDFHIHYWMCRGGLVELARVVHHNDFHICH